ncbi:hypothetical protein GCM10009609_21840 [Pseudonocardia aurantiaca]|uniref:SDR family NAD(P)-dependent oxidoreductase n=1 Tax=Pseudonocardia aurantiaca TaxID=75290 RepID=A0ABW4FEV3_9PSEU
MTSTLPTRVTSSRAPRPVGTVLITGAASGLGRAVAHAGAAAGGRPLLLTRALATEVADAVRYGLTRPEGCEVRELVVCTAPEPSWP